MRGDKRGKMWWIFPPTPNFQWNVNVQRQKAKGVEHWNRRLRSEVKTTRLNADICLHAFQRGGAWFKNEFQRRTLGVDLADAASNVRWLNIFLSPHLSNQELLVVVWVTEYKIKFAKSIKIKRKKSEQINIKQMDTHNHCVRNSCTN